MADTQNDAPQRRRYLTLDGLRGIAALMVVFYHCGGGRIGVWAPRFGYLAVDLFFLLSGFVLSYAYDDRLRQGLTVKAFLTARVLRLYPLYLVGLLLGACVVTRNTEIPGLTGWDAAISTLFGLTGLPSPTLLSFRWLPASYQAFIFPTNPPFWSLFFEFWVANVIFASCRRRLVGKTLMAVIFAGAVGMLVSEKLFYTVSVGWTWDDFLPGFARVGFSFFLGVAIARFHAHRRPRLRIPSWLFLAALAAILSLPLEGRAAHFFELASIFLFFPAMVYWGAEATERRPWIGAALGDTSYALYVIHYPLLVICVRVLHRLSLRPNLELQLSFVSLCALLAWLASIVDGRIRSRLRSMTAWVSSPAFAKDCPAPGPPSLSRQ